jgi:PadR family transcriptional regulator PadR
MDSTQVLKGLLDTATLGALSRGPTHGYDLVQRLHGSGLTAVAEASVYGTLRRLFRSGYLTAEVRESNAGPPRKVYALNEKGLEQLSSSRKTWAELRTAIDTLIGSEKEDR